MADTNTRRRVKLYMLNEDRLWDDRGTGHVSSVYVEKLKGMSLLVRSETDGLVLLESKIQAHTAYQKQQDTLIVWSEADNYDFALSFQEKAGCDEIWEKICQVQGKDPSVDITQDLEQESEELEDDRFDEPNDTALPCELPASELSKLEEISELFNSVLLSPIRREKLALAIENDSYIQKLIDIFHMCEDLENIDGLHHLYDIFKSIFLLNKNALFEIMFADDLMFDVVGVLEYDPSLPEKSNHRDYLRTCAHFREVISLNNSDLVAKIHQTYRVQYIQDVILPTPSMFEENMLSTLNSFIFFNKVEIINMIQEDEKFLQTLFAQLVDEDTEDSKRRDLTLFLKEFCTFSQTLQAQSRDYSFFKTLSNMGILGALEIILGMEDEQMKSAAIDIFSYIVEFSPSMVREYILQEGQRQDDEDILINLVLEQMIGDKDPDVGGAVQLMGIIRLLVDPENMLGTTNKTEKTEFLSFFYRHSMHVLAAPLFANTVEDEPSIDDYQTCQLLSLILELVTFCVEHHSYHIKNYIVGKDLVRRVLILLKSKHAFLALSALRLVRKVVGLKDEFYYRYIIKGDLIGPIVEAFVANGTKYNLLNSAMIELFEFIKFEDIKSLTCYIVEKHYSAFESVSYVQTFKNLKQRYEQHQDRLKDKTNLESVPSILRNNHSRFRREARTLEEEEEMWFDQEDEIEEADRVMPVSEMFMGRLGTDLDQINKFLERNRTASAKETDLKESLKESPPKLYNRNTANSININVSRSPPNNNPSPTPMSSPEGSPLEDKTNVQTKKPGVVGLVDYPDEDSEEDEEDNDGGMLPASKRPRLST